MGCRGTGWLSIGDSRNNLSSSLLFYFGLYHLISPSRTIYMSVLYSHHAYKLLNRDYFRRIEAVEFTLKADDGQAPWLLRDADVVIVGVSRTGKTPLSVVLSQMMGWKVGNVPLVLEVPPPAQLLDMDEIDSKRVFCLTINPKDLKRIRERRLEMRGVKEQEKRIDSLSGVNVNTKSNYADRNYLLKDLKNARELCLAQGWTEVDVTGRAVEETAAVLSEIMTKRFEDDS